MLQIQNGQSPFVAHLGGKFNAATAGDYTFQSRSDDGTVVWVDGVPVLDNNHSQGQTVRTGTINLTLGLHDIVVGYYQGNGGNGFSVGVTLPGQGQSFTIGAELNMSNALLSYGSNTLTIGGLTGSGTAAIGTGTLEVNGAGNNDFSGSLTGSGVGCFLKTGAGTQTLSGNNNAFTAGYCINGGKLSVASAAALGITGPISFGGGILQHTAANTTDYSARFDTSAGQLYKIDTNGQNVIWATNLVSVGGTLTKSGAGKLTVTGVNTYNGLTTITNGTLNINGNTALGAISGGVAISNNAILQAAAPVTTNRAITLGVGGGTIDTNGNTVTLDTGSSVTGAATVALTHTGAGNLDIKGTQSYDILNANGGLTTLDSALGTGTSTLNANATTQINVSQTLSVLNIADGVEVTFGTGLPFAGAPEKSGGFTAAFTPPIGGAAIGGSAVVPEPGSVGLLLVGALGLLGRRRRSRSAH